MHILLCSAPVLTSFQHVTHTIPVAFLLCFVYLTTQVHILSCPTLVSTSFKHTTHTIYVECQSQFQHLVVNLILQITQTMKFFTISLTYGTGQKYTALSTKKQGQIRVDLEVMVMKINITFPKGPELELHQRMQFCIIHPLLHEGWE